MQRPKRKNRGWLILAGIIVILAGAAFGGYGGYQSGMQSRMDLQSSQVAMTAATHFQIGLNNLNDEQYELARVHFEYVIKLDPNFPGVREKLAQTLVEMSRTEVPTATATVTLTPTPDMRGEQDLFDQIQKNLVDKNWDAAIRASETLRTKNLTYRTVDVDGMYYIALRYRGVDRILRLGDLEGGMYDLALVQRFGPLDRDADSYRLFARYYAVGASFWEVDWEKSVYYFGQVVPFLPMLRDASGIAAIDRYRTAAISYAAQLINADDYCKAEKILSEVLANNYKNATAEPLLEKASQECHPATETPQPTQAASATPTITVTRSDPGRHDRSNAASQHRDPGPDQRGHADRGPDHGPDCRGNDSASRCDRYGPGAIQNARSANSHQETMTLYSPVMLVTIYWLHMLATVAWIGGQTALAVLVLPAARKTIAGASGYSEFISQVSKRLQLTGWLSLFILTATGLFQMSANPSYKGFLAVSNPWATAILLKHLVIGALVLSSAYLTWGLTPALERMILLQTHGKGSPAELSVLQKREEGLIQINLFISVVVLLLTAWARSTVG